MRDILAITTLTAVLVMAAGPASAQEISDAKKTEAKGLFKDGVKLFKSGKHAQALDKFKKTFDIWPHWRFHLNMGLCYKELSMFLEAKKELSIFMTEGASQTSDSESSYYGAKKAQVQDSLDELAEIIAVLIVQVTPDGATVKLDGKIAGTTPLAEPVDANPGAHVLEIVADDHHPHREEFFVTEGQEKTFEIALEAKPIEVPDPVTPVGPVEPTGDVRHKAAPVFWVMGGLTLALAGGAAATGAMTIIADKDITKLDKDATKAVNGELTWSDQDWDDYENDRKDIQDKGKLLGPITTGLMIAAGAALVGTVVTGVVLKPFAPKAESPDGDADTPLETEEKPVAFSIAPVPLAEGGGMIVIGGAF